MDPVKQVYVRTVRCEFVRVTGLQNIREEGELTGMVISHYEELGLSLEWRTNERGAMEYARKDRFKILVDERIRSVNDLYQFIVDAVAEIRAKTPHA